MSADEYTNQIESESVNVLDRICPIQRKAKFASTRLTNRWLSPEACRAKRRRRRLERKWKKSGSDEVRVKYRQACREANEAIINSRSQYYAGQIDHAQANPRKKWSIIRSLLHSSTKAEYRSESECRVLADKLILFFADKVKLIKLKLSAMFPNSSLDPMHADRPHVGDRLLSYNPPSVREVGSLIMSLPNKSSATDKIPVAILKSCCNIFAPVIARLAYLSFHEGVFPTTFKTASVTPILKKKGLDEANLTNYRPISNLNTI